VISARRAAHLTVLLLLGVLSACGKKGPPLPPLQLVPSRIEDLTVTRRADDLEMRFTVPATNEDPKHKTPADIAAVEVYALTGKAEDPFGNPLTQAELLKYSTKVGTITIKPPPKPDESDESDKDKDKKTGSDKSGGENKAAAAQRALKASLPPDPRPGQGDIVTMKETVTPALMTPWVHPKKKKGQDTGTGTGGRTPQGGARAPGQGGQGAPPSGASGASGASSDAASPPGASSVPGATPGGTAPDGTPPGMSGMSSDGGGMRQGGMSGRGGGMSGQGQGTARQRMPRGKGLKGAQGEEGEGIELPGLPLWWPPAEDVLSRVYVAVGVNHGGKKSTPSNKVFLPLLEAPQAPAALDIKYDASALTVNWEPPSDARLPMQRAPEPGMLTARPIVDSGGITTYNVYDAKALSAAAKGSSPASIGSIGGAGGLGGVGGVAAAALAAKAIVVAPLNPAPLDKATFTDNRLAYGEERCYVVRAVLLYGGARLESPASSQACVTPKDTFAPTAPKNLAGVGSEGGVSLIWEADSEPDLDGYLVLRGELKPDGTQPETLKPITPEPIHETTYRDSTAKPGVRYVYAVVAVDHATPRNVSAESNRIEESAR
jgi:predicted small lipoprotein YifL